MKLDFIENMSEETVEDCILKGVLRKYFDSDDLDKVKVAPSQIVCDPIEFMVLSQHMIDVEVEINGNSMRLFDLIEPFYGVHCFCVFYASDNLKKVKLATAFL